MEKETLIIAYDGEALQSHEMDIDELALALTGLADLFKNTSQELIKKDTAISLKISSLAPGSFEIHTVLEYMNKGFKLFNSDSGIGLKNILEILGLIGGAGLIQFIAKIKDNQIIKVTENNNNLEITYNEGSKNKTTIINKQVYALFNNINVTNSFNKILKPLQKEGITSFETRTKDKKVISQITKEEAQYYKPRQDNSILDISEADMWLNLVNVSFKDGNKWRFSSGDENDFYANITDDDFLLRVNQNEIQFSKGDTLKAHLQIAQTMTSKGIKNEYTITKILEYRSIKQLKLNY